MTWALLMSLKPLVEIGWLYYSSEKMCRAVSFGLVCLLN